MRTTIEMKEEHRARLLEMAARRGKKGFSELVAEAIEAYLESARRNQEQRKAAQALRGILNDAEVQHLRQQTAKIRESWR